ncbi:sulfotransferase family 2 domain-containing protein [Primorskyibacter sp. 2E107]|uniref:sulfotransferase family 2 domain-containing protein n=1 Tax=Primorskyibacter sp. 2E107 TaxID=3403458 RepID=UPI003AF5634E
MVVRIEAYQLAYVPLPKAACSSVKKALALLDPVVSLPPRETRDVHTWHRLYPTRRFRARQMARLEGYFRFCVVRDPLARLLSVWTNRVQEFGDLRNAWSLQSGRVALPMEPDPDFFFSHLTAYAQAVSGIKHHVLPAPVFLGPDLGAYSRVYRTEEMAILGEDLSQRCNQAVSLPRANSSGTRLRAEDLKPATLDALRVRLDAEYGFLSSYYDNPFDVRSHGACVTPSARLS